MGVHIHSRTIDEGLTPICNECGVSLCWDISDLEYISYKEFWDDWICQDCNGGQRMSRSDYYGEKQ